MTLYNSNGQRNVTIVSGGTYTGIQSNDGSYNGVLNDGTGIKGLYHPCGAYNVCIVGDPYSGIQATNGSMNIMSSGSGYVLIGGNPPATPAYLGQVATRSFIPSATFSNTQFQSRSFHRARSGITALKLILPNFIATTTGESAGSGGTATVTAAIETSSGQFFQVLFSGSASTTITNGNYVTSDFVNVTINKDDFFYVRVHWSHPSTIIFGGGNANIGVGEAFTFSNSVADQTMGGTVVNTSGSFPMYFPAAILAMTTNKSIGLVGDSKMLGGNDIPDSTGDMGEYARSVGGRYGYIQMGIGSDTAQEFVASNTLRTQLLQFCSDVIVNYGTNDLVANSRTAAQTLADLQTISNLITKKTYQATIEPRTTGSWSTIGGQTVTAAEAQRLLLNTSIRAGTGFRGFFEIANVLESAPNSGFWNCPVGGGGTASAVLTADGIHPNNTACLLVKNSNAITI